MAFQPSERAINVTEQYYPHVQSVTLTHHDYGFVIGDVLIEPVGISSHQAHVGVFAPGANVVRANRFGNTYVEPFYPKKTGELALTLNEGTDLPVEVDVRLFTGLQTTVKYEGGHIRRDGYKAKFTIETMGDVDVKVIKTLDELLKIKKRLQVQG